MQLKSYKEERGMQLKSYKQERVTYVIKEL